MKIVEDEEVGGALFDFAVAVSSVRDWLRAHPSASFSVADVDATAKVQALEVFRDISNGSKHRTLRYTPDTREVLVSAQPGPVTYLAVSQKNVQLYTTGPKLKAVTSDGYRHEVLQLANDAVTTWRDFLVTHRV